jgi:hypothetical protein
MRHVSDEELEQIRTEVGEKYKWKPQTITTYRANYETKYLPQIKNKLIMFQCLKCHEHYIHNECGNCSRTKFEIGFGESMDCTTCERGFSSWTCGYCRTDNPVSKTLFLLEKGCFIATATYGSVLAPEVVLLRQFRDIKLTSHRLGNWVILIYEELSPPLADWITQHPTARTWVQRVILSPIIHVVRRLMPTTHNNLSN